MKKIEMLGKVLSKKDQKKIQGGVIDPGKCTEGSCGANGEDDNCALKIGYGCACHSDNGSWVCRTNR